MKRKRLTKTIEVYRNKQVVPIDFRLPGDAVSCAGVQAMVVGLIPTERPVIPVFGEYSLEFEGKKIHPVNFCAPYINPQLHNEETQHRPGFLPLGVPIGENRLVTGFYSDLGEQITPLNLVFQPYRVRITFDLITR
ncbi:MAG TPA: hypothetical protein DIW47_06325 [Bacteroidetes bacterium]|nr:hypothetical protein [Bacteroidota bacterium]